MLRLGGPVFLTTVKVGQFNDFLFSTALCNCYRNVRARIGRLRLLVLTGGSGGVLESAIFEATTEFGRANQTVIVLFA
jgi:hypothetical protein